MKVCVMPVKFTCIINSNRSPAVAAPAAVAVSPMLPYLKGTNEILSPKLNSVPDKKNLLPTDRGTSTHTSARFSIQPPPFTFHTLFLHSSDQKRQKHNFLISLQSLLLLRLLLLQRFERWQRIQGNLYCSNTVRYVIGMHTMTKHASATV